MSIKGVLVISLTFVVVVVDVFSMQPFPWERGMGHPLPLLHPIV
jgi:hypothetical protein